MVCTRPIRLAVAIVTVSCASVACGADGDGREPTTAGSIGSLGSATANPGDTTDAATAGSSAGEVGTAATDADTNPTVFDLGSADGESGGPMDTGCQRVDFLFVIDNSVSMQDNQASLVGAFPGFIAAIQDTLQANSDYHILVTDTDAWGRCDTVNGFDGIDPTSNTCNNYIKTTVFEECDAVRGAGVVHPAGQYATNAPCALSGGNRYIVPGEPDLPGSFACIATVGVAGHSSERPMESMSAALSPELNAAAACNDGFLRDDALLVIAFVSDDPAYEDTGTPAEWYQAVLDAKEGDPSGVVVLGLTPAWDECPGNGDPKGAHWAEFVGMWGDRGVHGSVCGTADDYVAFFQSAVATIDTACDEFDPPG